MEANELRIGNYIKDRGGKIWQIDHWEYADKVSAKSNVMGYFDDEKTLPTMSHPLTEYVEFLQPIPLTEDILLKCGFEKMPVDSFIKNDVELSFCDGRDYAFFCKAPYSKLNFLHQLQNLYFALTNTELEWNGSL